ncbi:hypothetical protein E4U21_005921 [Claviceps maximensis]|nr:hypothetical protein E4U21_005921 [Claviceps maximensis]
MSVAGSKKMQGGDDGAGDDAEDNMEHAHCGSLVRELDEGGRATPQWSLDQARPGQAPGWILQHALQRIVFGADWLVVRHVTPAIGTAAFAHARPVTPRALTRAAKSDCIDNTWRHMWPRYFATAHNKLG